MISEFIQNLFSQVFVILLVIASVFFWKMERKFLSIIAVMIAVFCLLGIDMLRQVVIFAVIGLCILFVKKGWFVTSGVSFVIGVILFIGIDTFVVDALNNMNELIVSWFIL